MAGEYWTAVSDSAEQISAGEEVVVLGTDGLVLKVFKALLSDVPEGNSTPEEEPG